MSDVRLKLDETFDRKLDETFNRFDRRMSDIRRKIDESFDRFERRTVVHRIEDLDREIAETRCWIAKHSPDERDIEFILLAENLRACWIKELEDLDRKLKDMDRPQKSLGELMIEACGGSKPRSLAPPREPK